MEFWQSEYFSIFKMHSFVVVDTFSEDRNFFQRNTFFSFLLPTIFFRTFQTKTNKTCNNSFDLSFLFLDMTFDPIFFWSILPHHSQRIYFNIEPCFYHSLVWHVRPPCPVLAQSHEKRPDCSNSSESSNSPSPARDWHLPLFWQGLWWHGSTVNVENVTDN